jgi:hypothetical protein
MVNKSGYTSFTITKKKDHYRVWATHSKDGWEGEGNFMDLYPVSGVLVAMRFMTKPVAVYKDLDDVCKQLEKQFGIKTVVKK